MQPKNVDRVKTLFQDYLTCTAEADFTLVTDIYEEREMEADKISGEKLVKGMREHNLRAYLTPKMQDAAAMIRDGVRPGDLVLTMGCGNIYLLNELLKLPEERSVNESCGQEPVAG